jgi:dCMP deaminase
MEQRFQEVYMKCAYNFSELSRAQRLKVGCVIVKNDSIIAYGYNGTPPGADNICEHRDEFGSLITIPSVVHAEMNAIAKVFSSTFNGEKSSVFCTHSPCFECSKLLISGKIKEMYYNEDYRCTAGIDHLKENGIPVYKTNIKIA